MGNIEQKISSNVRKLYAYWFFQNLVFAYVIERLFGLERGLTIQQMVYLEIIYAVVVLALEVPTGAWADRWSRKNMMILSAAFAFFELFVLIFAYDFWTFALSILCAASAGALASGTSNAIFYDSLKAGGNEKNYEKVLGRSGLWDGLAGMIAAVTGGFVAAKLGFTFTYWISLAGVGVSFLIALTLYEPKKQTSTGETEFWRLIRDAYKFLRNQPTLQFVLLYGIIIASTWVYLDEYWQVYLKEINIPLFFFGFYSVGAQLLVSLGGIAAPYLKKRFSYKFIFSVLLLASGLSILAASMMNRWYGAAILLAIHITVGIIEPLISGYLHHRTSSHYRATVDSFHSFALRAATIAVGLLFGYAATHFGIFSGFKALSLVLLAYSVYYIFFQFRFVEEHALKNL